MWRWYRPGKAIFLPISAGKENSFDGRKDNLDGNENTGRNSLSRKLAQAARSQKVKFRLISWEGFLSLILSSRESRLSFVILNRTHFCCQTSHELNPPIYRIFHTLKNFAVHPKIRPKFSSESPLENIWAYPRKHTIILTDNRIDFCFSGNSGLLSPIDQSRAFLWGSVISRCSWHSVRLKFEGAVLPFVTTRVYYLTGRSHFKMAAWCSNVQGKFQGLTPARVEIFIFRIQHIYVFKL